MFNKEQFEQLLQQAMSSGDANQIKQVEDIIAQLKQTIEQTQPMKNMPGAAEALAQMQEAIDMYAEYAG